MIQQRIIEAFRAEQEHAKQPGYVSAYDEYDLENEFAEASEPPAPPPPHARPSRPQHVVQTKVEPAEPARAAQDSNPHAGPTHRGRPQPGCVWGGDFLAELHHSARCRSHGRSRPAVVNTDRSPTPSSHCWTSQQWHPWAVLPYLDRVSCLSDQLLENFKWDPCTHVSTENCPTASQNSILATTFF